MKQRLVVQILRRKHYNDQQKRNSTIRLFLCAWWSTVWHSL